MFIFFKVVRTRVEYMTSKSDLVKNSQQKNWTVRTKIANRLNPGKKLVKKVENC